MSWFLKRARLMKKGNNRKKNKSTAFLPHHQAPAFASNRDQHITVWAIRSMINLLQCNKINCNSNYSTAQKMLGWFPLVVNLTKTVISGVFSYWRLARWYEFIWTKNKIFPWLLELWQLSTISAHFCLYHPVSTFSLHRKKCFEDLETHWVIEFLFSSLWRYDFWDLKYYLWDLWILNMSGSRSKILDNCNFTEKKIYISLEQYCFQKF